MGQPNSIVNRKGYVNFSRDTIRQLETDILAALFANFFPLAITENMYNDMTFYYGISPHFRELPTGVRCPQYKPHFTKGPNGIYQFVEFEEVDDDFSQVGSPENMAQLIIVEN